MHESSEEFENRLDLTTDCGDSCPLASEEIPIDLQWEKHCSHFFSAVLIGSFTYLQVTIAYIGAWMSSKFDQILPRTTEINGLDHQKSMLPLFLDCYLFELFNFVAIEDMHNI